MPLALAVMAGLYVWTVMRRTRRGGLAEDETARIDRLLWFLRLGLALVSIVAMGALLLASRMRAGVEGEADDLLPVFVVGGTIASYGITVISAVWCIVEHRRAGGATKT